MDNLFKDLQDAITSKDELSIMLLQTKIDVMLFEVLAAIQYGMDNTSYVNLVNSGGFDYE